MWKFIRLALICGPRILWNYATKITRYGRHPEKYPIEKRYKVTRNLIGFVTNKLRLNLHLEGEEYLNPETPCLFVGNHLSMTDIVLITSLSRKPLAFVSKIEAAHRPFVASGLRAMGGLFLDRNDIRASVGVLLEAEKKISSKTESMVIYPEGTRNKVPDSDPLEFHGGSFKIATRCNCPIIVLSGYGTARPLDTKLNYKSYPVFLNITKVEPSEYANMSTTELAAYCRNIVAKNVSRFREMDKEYMSKKLYNQKLPKGKNTWWYKFK